MILSEQDLATLRTHPQSTKYYVSLGLRASVFEGRLDGDFGVGYGDFGILADDVSGGIFAIRYKNSTGNALDVEEGMTVEFGTAQGKRDLGVSYVRSKIDTFNSLILITETPFGDLPIYDNCYVRVVREFRPRQKKLRLVAQTEGGSPYPTNFIEYHDYDKAYLNQNFQIQPIANVNLNNDNGILPYIPAGFVSDDGYRYITLTAKYSYSFSNSPLAYQWSFQNAEEYITGDSTSESVYIRLPQGFYWCSLRVTDMGTNATTLRRFPIWCHDNVYAPMLSNTGFQITKDTTNDYREMSLRVFGQNTALNEMNFPNGAMLCVWNEPTFDIYQPPNSYRRAFLGWVSSDTTSMKRNASEFTVDVGSLGWWLDNIKGFGTQITDPVNRLPERWYEMSHITMPKMVHYLLREYSNALELGNLHVPEVNRFIQSETAKSESIWKQITTIADAYSPSHIVRADSMNNIFIRPFAPYVRKEDRSAIPTVWNLTSDDILDDSAFEYTVRNSKPIGRIDGSGASWQYGDAEPVLYNSRAPGKMSGDGDGTESAPFLRVLDEEDLNWATGLRYAYANRTIPEMKLKLIGIPDVVEPAWGSTIRLQWDEDNIRDITISSQDRWFVQGVDVLHSVDGKPIQIEMIVVPETFGMPGVSIPIPQGEEWTEDPFKDLRYRFMPSIWSYQNNAQNEDEIAQYEDVSLGFAVMATQNYTKILRTFHYLDEHVIWENITPVLPSASYKLMDTHFFRMGQQLRAYALFLNPNNKNVFIAKSTDVATFDEVVWTTFAVMNYENTNYPDMVIYSMSIHANANDTVVGIGVLTNEFCFAQVYDSGSWGNIKQVGGQYAYDTQNLANKRCKIFVDGNTVYFGGRNGIDDYRLFSAVTVGNFVMVPASPKFQSPICTIEKHTVENYLLISSWSGEPLFQFNVNYLFPITNIPPQLTNISAEDYTTPTYQNSSNIIYTGVVAPSYNYGMGTRYVPLTGAMHVTATFADISGLDYGIDDAGYGLEYFFYTPTLWVVKEFTPPYPPGHPIYDVDPFQATINVSVAVTFNDGNAEVLNVTGIVVTHDTSRPFNWVEPDTGNLYTMYHQYTHNDYVWQDSNGYNVTPFLRVTLDPDKRRYPVSMTQHIQWNIVNSMTGYKFVLTQANTGGLASIPYAYNKAVPMSNRLYLKDEFNTWSDVTPANNYTARYPHSIHIDAEGTIYMAGHRSASHRFPMLLVSNPDFFVGYLPAASHKWTSYDNIQPTTVQGLNRQILAAGGKTLNQHHLKLNGLTNSVGIDRYGDLTTKAGLNTVADNLKVYDL